MSYVFRARVVDIREVKTRQHVGGVGEQASFAERVEGWQVSLVIGDSRMGIIFPDVKPEFAVDDIVRISMTVEKEKPE